MDESPNVVLIVCDTLRRDILELYGGPAKTPSLKKLAKDAMVYENAIAPSPWTFPSHVSLFTGKYPSQHGIHETDKLKLFDLAGAHSKMKSERVAEFLNNSHYKTLGLSNNIMVSRFTAFDPGFDYFTNIETNLLQSKEAKEASQLGASAGQVAATLIRKGRYSDMIRYAREFLRMKYVASVSKYPFNKGAELTNNLLFNSKLQQSFFLFLNFMEAHEPYKGHSGNEKNKIFDDFAGVRPISSSEIEVLKKRYIAEIEYLDKNLGVLIEMLKLRDVYDNTMIIITSDHGQAFKEHGYMYHGVYLYDEIIRVPLVIKYPGSRKFKAVEGYQSLTNIFPLIRNVVEESGEIQGYNDKVLTSKIAFSEGYGDDKVLPKSYDGRKEYIHAKHEKFRKAVYKGGFKLTVNGTDGKIEEFSKDGKGKDPKEYGKQVRDLMSELKKFAKHDDFKFPQS